MDSTLERLVRHRANGMCEYCRMPQRFDESDFEIDHIIAKQHDGPSLATNLCVACFGYAITIRARIWRAGTK